METNAKATVAKKGNKTTEIIVGAAANKLSTAVKGLNSAIEEVGKLEVKAQDYTLQISDLEDKIGGLKQDLQNKVAQNKIELQQQYDTDKKAFAVKWLTENDMIFILNDELTKLKESLVEAQMNVEEKVSKAVGAATGALKSDYVNQLKLTTLEHEKKEADNSAKITQQESQIKFLNEQVVMWKTALEDERRASVERAKASIGTLNIGGQQGR